MDVWSRGGKCARQLVVELSHVASHTGLIAFDGEQIIPALFLHHDARGLGLGIKSVSGNQRAIQVHSFEQALYCRDLVGTLDYWFGAQPASALNRVGADNLRSLAIEQFLAVGRNLVAFGIA